jgi:hypothetical protein
MNAVQSSLSSSAHNSSPLAASALRSMPSWSLAHVIMLLSLIYSCC